jgi:citrate lyase subunit beta / citryl-CoA lyase
MSRPYRLRRSCLSVPASSPKMLAKAPTLPADQVFMDLEDSVAPLEKESARASVVDALKNSDWGGKTVVVRINAWDSKWTYRDVIDIVEPAGQHLDCVMLPKVQTADDVIALDKLLTQIEEWVGIDKEIGIEAQIENARGLVNVDEIAFASGRLETIIFGPADFAASLQMPILTGGVEIPDYPGDHWHYVFMRILMAARAAGLQAIDGPYLKIRDSEGFRRYSTRTRILGYDGKWALHPDQISILNELFTPSQEAFDHSIHLLEAYETATTIDRKGAVMFGDEMIDEASRKMAEQFKMRGEAAGMKRSTTSKEA